ncbi:hypothetical protein [Legionella parisiensis]|uniref:Uncharacterized protein n=1 Tax=Legionella parisiensis TaxID=45071 RepID=A0A1E5JRB6_9GAMM|nr:hypothetical protein [Legionella parisiensis]KTD44784.1 hypothetical protein Lpar_0185 [Legionella parisiensis]OEH47062.1 hypothetical protein lpari_01968 [Legionella parisiensis]STX71767.1 Uncharacterised protein [Legionella parisiensis]
MLVQRILDFIQTLEREDKLITCDAMLRECLFDRFSKRVARDDLTSDDFFYLLACYKSRWEAIVDRDDDYTRNPSAINQHWIDLAKEFAPLVRINYLKILIPTLVNEKDLNDFSSLDETVNLFNFYLGHGGKTLYRKLSFCKHLESWQFELSTYRADKKLSVVTVDELARLKLCKQTSREVSVNSESFKNFWDLMRKKVFVKLQNRGHMPIAFLPHLVELIEQYYLMQASGLEFTHFKKEINNLFRRLYDYNLADVNYLYGTKIKYKEDEQYLLDLFIALHTANNYEEINYEVQMLGKWLFQFNPDLKAASKELAPVYQVLAKESREEPFIKSDAFVNCCKLLVSLFTTQFELSFFFTRQTHSLWDKKNNVFPEAYGIFTVLLPLVAANKPKALEAAYEEIIHDIIIPARRDNSFYTWFTRYKPTIQWLELVQNCKLNELGVHWFEPELLFNALQLFDTKNPSVQMRINHLLDDIIQTYAQNQNELMKQFRVNILFTEFLNGLSEYHSKRLLILIRLCDLERAKSQFLSNCTKHINAQIAQLCQSTESSPLCFFSRPRNKADRVDFFKLPEKAKDVESIIVEYKTKLSELSIEPGNSENISTYLFKLGQPILTVTQKEKAKNSGRPVLDYIGQYT